MKISEVKRHVFTGVSFMIPVIVLGGLCMAIAKLLGGYTGGEEGSIAYTINELGKISMKFVVPVISAGIAYSISERQGIAPGLVIGWLCNNIKAGFIGGIISGFLVGFFVLFYKKNIRLPKALDGVKSILLMPLLVTLTSGLLMIFVIGVPIVAFQETLFNYLKTLQDGSRFVLGAVIGGAMGFDMGGPVNKTASLFSNSLLAEGIYLTSASKIVGGMTPPLGIGLAVLLMKNKYTQAEREAAKAAIPLGFCFITEGVLPFVASDPLRVIPASMLGSALAGGLVSKWEVICTLLHGGIFIVPLIESNKIGFLLALLLGSLTTAGSLMLLKVLQKNVEKVDKEEIEEEFSFEIKEF